MSRPRPRSDFKPTSFCICPRGQSEQNQYKKVDILSGTDTVRKVVGKSSLNPPGHLVPTALGGVFFLLRLRSCSFALEACLSTSSAGISSRCLQNSTGALLDRIVATPKDCTKPRIADPSHSAPQTQKSAPAWLRQSELHDQSPKLQKTSSQRQLQFLHSKAFPKSKFLHKHAEPQCTKSILLFFFHECRRHGRCAQVIVEGQETLQIEGEANQNSQKKTTNKTPNPTPNRKQLDDEWPKNIFHHVGSQSVSCLLSVQCEVSSRVS